jgi:retinol dehydrogenase-12
MVTGFTSGLGQAGAFELAARGANLTLVCRNRVKGEETIAAITVQTPESKPRLIVADLGVMADIRRAADEFLSTGDPLHVLFNNAGVINQNRAETTEGLEMTFAVNHLGYFLLTNLLLPRLRETPGARVVSTASHAHKFAGGALRLDDLQAKSGYSFFFVYGQSKLANILFTRELARREVGNDITANCFHPGFVGSGFSKNNGVLARGTMVLAKPFARTPAKGAETGVYLCSSPEVGQTTGSYFFNNKAIQPNRHGRSDEDAAALWKISEEFTGLA